MSVTIEGITFNGDDPYQRVDFRGFTNPDNCFNKRTAAFVLAVEADLGHRLTFFQGGYNPGGVNASGGTHDAGGVFDCWDVFNSDPLHVQRTLRKHGGFAWYRKALPGVWNEHIHCGVLGDDQMSLALRAQIPDYRGYRDGLASHASDNTWHPFVMGDDPQPIFNYPKWVKEYDVQFDDIIPATYNKKVGDALRAALNMEGALATFRQNELDRDVKEAERDQNLWDKLAAIEDLVKKL